MRTLEEVSASVRLAEEQVAKLEKAQPHRRWKNRAYVFDFAWAPVAEPVDPTLGVGTPFPYQEQMVNIPRESVAHIVAADSVFSLIGTFDDGSSASVVVPTARRQAFFDFDFKIRETGNDRELQDEWMPGALLCTGNSGPFQSNTSQAVIPGGSTVIVAVNARLLASLVDIVSPGVTSITGYALSITLSGWEVLQ